MLLILLEQLISLWMVFPRAQLWVLCSSLYIFHLSAKIIVSYGIHFHCCADNSGLCLHIKVDD